MKLRLLLGLAAPPPGALAGIAVLMLISSAALLLQPWLAGRVTTLILEGQSHAVTPLLMAWLAVAAGRALLDMGEHYLAGACGEDLSADLRGRVYGQLQGLSLGWHQAGAPGESLALLTRDADRVGSLITDTLMPMLPGAVTFLGAFALMLWIDPLIALVAAGLLPAYTLAMKLLGRKLRPLAKQWNESWAAFYALAQENIGLLPVIKAFTRETVESGRLAQRNESVRLLSRRQLLVQSVLSPAVGLMATAGLLLLIWIGAGHVSSGRLEAGQFVSLLLYALLLTRPIAEFARVYGQVQQTRGAAERLDALFNQAPEPDAGTQSLPKPLAGEIQFHAVSYAYPGRPDAVREINLSIKAGETVALTGPNGAGKSTLAWLLMRFADPDTGHIFIDGIDIRTLRLAELRQQVGLVAQHTLLLNGSVRDNIGYAAHGAVSAAEIENAARAAGAAEFIDALPDGYDTLIGDQGVRLSGGQRQRIALARMLLRDPRVVILDEATSMLDPEGEANFLAAARGLLRSRTVILITHRPGPLKHADRLIRLDAGQVRDTDTDNTRPG